MQEQFCTQCGRHCPVNNLHCGRGRAYFQAKQEEENRQKEASPQPSVKETKTENSPIKEKSPEERSTDERIMKNLKHLGKKSRHYHSHRGGKKRILRILNELEQVTQHKLAASLNMTPETANEILEKLERSGMITRESDSGNPENTVIRLTSLGQEKAEEISSNPELKDDFFSCLTQDEKTELLNLLDRVREDWKKRYIKEKKHAKFHHKHHKGGAHKHKHHRH